jgi:hypothetical protein
MCDIVFEFGKAPTTGADLGTNMGAFTALAERVVGDTGRFDAEMDWDSGW